MMQNLSALFKSTIKTLEILYVLENKKPVARVLVNEDEISNIIDFLKNNNIEYLISNFKLKKINGNSCYSDKSLKIDKNSMEKGYFVLYISKIKELADKAKEYEENNMHLELGMVLGYPKCCCEFFKENFNENNYDLTLSALNNSEGYEFPFYTNIATRHFDISLLNHFPCSFNCKPSIEIAKENLETIKKLSEQLHDSFKNIMKCAVLYTQNGIFVLKDYKKINNEISFENVVPSVKNQTYNDLLENKQLKIINRNNVKIKNETINNIGFMIFT